MSTVHKLKGEKFLRLEPMTGNEAVAEAMRQINPDVVAAYPITPQTEVVQVYSEFVADGLVDTEMIPVESEHSAMSACIGAAAAGARAMTATSSQGLAFMWEMLYVAAGMRLPIVMPVVNRTLSSNLNIHCDHSDTMGARDSGWIQLFSENAQEAYDNVIQAVPIAERVRLPVMVMLDGFIISHAMEPVEVIDDESVKEFVGEYQPTHSILDVDHPITMGPVDLFDYYFEHKRAQAEAMRNSFSVIRQVAEEFAQKFGRHYGFLELWRCDDADIVVVALGSTCGTAKLAVDSLRGNGVSAGLVKIRVFRPFPLRELRQLLGAKRAVAVMDRSEGLSGWGGPVFAEVKAALYGLQQPPQVINFIYGLGGRNVTVEQIESVFAQLLELEKGVEPTEPVQYLGVRD